MCVVCVRGLRTDALLPHIPRSSYVDVAMVRMHACAMHIPDFTVKNVHVIVMNDKRVSGALPLYPPSGNDTGLCRGLPVQSVRGRTGVRSLVQSQKLAGTPSPGLLSLLCTRTQRRTRLLQGSQACQDEVHREWPQAMNYNCKPSPYHQYYSCSLYYIILFYGLYYCIAFPYCTCMMKKQRRQLNPNFVKAHKRPSAEAEGGVHVSVPSGVPSALFRQARRSGQFNLSNR